jgi:hypothetical protein
METSGNLQDFAQVHGSTLDAALAAYKTRCDRLASEAKTKIAQTPEGDSDALNVILAAEKQGLDDAFAELQQAIAQANKAYYHQVENTSRSEDETIMSDLESQLNDT